MSPVVSLKAQCSAPLCLFCICSPSVMSSAGMQYNFIAMLMTLNFNLTLTAALSSSTLTTCLEEVKAWMSENVLHLNSSKTEVILVGTPHQVLISVIFSMTFSVQNIPLSASFINFCVRMDSYLTFEAHVKHLCICVFFHLRNITRLRPMLTSADAEKLVHSFVLSRLDYRNALLIGIPGKSLQKLEYIQNSAAEGTQIRSYHPHSQIITLASGLFIRSPSLPISASMVTPHHISRNFLLHKCLNLNSALHQHIS